MKLVQWSWQNDNIPSMRIEIAKTQQRFIITRSGKDWRLYLPGYEGQSGARLYGAVKPMFESIKRRVREEILRQLSGAEQ